MAEKRMSKPLSLSAIEVRRHDWDRFICTLFAPEDRREDLFTLLAFNLELARTREMVRSRLLARCDCSGGGMPLKASMMVHGD